jgi:hypothetical protein
VTPHEKLTGEVPNLDRVRVFGCPAFVLSEPSTSAGVQANAIRGTMVGYDIDSPMYRVFVWESRKVVKSGSVTFDEEFDSSSNKSPVSDPTSRALKVDDIYIQNLFDEHVEESSDVITNGGTDLVSQSTPQVNSEHSDHVSTDVLPTPTTLRVSTRPKVKPLVLTADSFGACSNKNLIANENYVLANVVNDRFTPSSYKEESIAMTKIRGLRVCPRR